MIVILRSLSFSIVLDAMIPGTPHPVPINIGMNDFPDKPNLRNTRSNTNAIRDIYPQASKNANNKNNTIICGTNPNTAPTPPTIPSTIKLCNQEEQCILSNKLFNKTGTPGTQIPNSEGSGTPCASSPKAASYIVDTSYPACARNLHKCHRLHQMLHSLLLGLHLLYPVHR